MPLGIVDAVKSAVAGADLVSIHGKATIPTGVALGAHHLYGLHVETEVLGTGSLNGFWDAARIELYAPDTVTLGGDVHGIYVNSYLAKTPVGEYALCRLEHGGAAKLMAYFVTALGGESTCDYFLQFGGKAANAWDVATDVTGKAKAGFLKVMSWGLPGGGDRFIQLYGP